MASRYALREDQWSGFGTCCRAGWAMSGVRRGIIGCLWKRSYTGIGRGFPGGTCPPGLGIFG